MRDDADDLQPDSAAFPSGLAALGRFLHDRGLLFGIYSSAGAVVCVRMRGDVARC